MTEDDFDVFANAQLDTLAVRAGQRRSGEGEHSEALYLTSSYVFDSAADAAARFSGESPGNVYSRYTNPTVRTFEERIAALEARDRQVARDGAERRREINEAWRQLNRDLRDAAGTTCFTTHGSFSSTTYCY